ncbi:cilia-and flagella-associated protein 96 [Petaurus breviceps papuanus]|uniref:cilia-and flagella-associated protein 96 n=1 Tax=Petaurus breviceps papuanus TaxID=3040969 RepID=UPI0036D84FB0
MPGEIGKSDMDRIGLFSEMDYITIGDKYVSPFNRPFNEAASKNRQMLPGGSKMMSALQQGFFEPQFLRIFEGEGYVSLNQVRRRYMLQEAKKNISKPFLPSNGEKKACGLGSYFGTIGGPVPFFSAQVKPKDKYIPPGKNLYTNPGKKGTGYGYANITIGKQLPHSVDLYDTAKVNIKKEIEDHHRLIKGTPFKLNLFPRDYFDVNPYFSDKTLPPLKKPEHPKAIGAPFKPPSPPKKAGGMKAGTFDPFPPYTNDQYGKKIGDKVVIKTDRIFHPSSGPKSRPVSSIMSANVKKSLNSKNYLTASVQSY